MDRCENKLHYFGRDLEAMDAAQNYYEWLIEEISPFLGDHVAEVGKNLLLAAEKI